MGLLAKLMGCLNCKITGGKLWKADGLLQQKQLIHN